MGICAANGHCLRDSGRCLRDEPEDVEELNQDILRKNALKAFAKKASKATYCLECDDKLDKGRGKAGGRRPPCKYGAKCYRKQGEHLAAFSHPGDPDWQQARRRCRYGAECYQKSSEHRAKFSHPGDPDYDTDAKDGKTDTRKEASRWNPNSKFNVDKVGELALLRTQAKGFEEKYELGKRLNAGAQGVTYLAKEKATGRTVVVKKPNDVKDTGDFDEIVEKKHPNIVRVFELFSNPWETFVVMECCSGGDLFAALASLGTPTQNWCAGVGKQAFRGTKYLHDQFMSSHNDIKPENILLDHKPASSSDVPRAMIADFGCAASSGSASHITGGGGDPRYRAPETWRGSPFSFATDVWALGVTLFELVSGGLLIYVNKPNVSGWANFLAADGGALCQAFLGAAQAGRSVDVNVLQTDLAQNLMGGLLHTNPFSRLSMDAAMKHPWFQLDESTAIVQLGADEGELLRRRAQSSKLRVALLNLVGSVLQGESIRYYKDIWLTYDQDGSGQMDYDEFLEMYNDTFAGLSPGAFGSSTLPTPEELFRIGDVTGNGYISFDEFIGLMFNADMLDEGEKLQYIKSAFKVLAGDDDEITAEEFASLFQETDTTVIYQLFQEIDQDKNAAIDFEEFASYIDSL